MKNTSFGWILLFVVIGFSVRYFFKIYNRQQRESEQIMRDFKTVDKDLHNQHAPATSIRDNYTDAEIKIKLIVLIDSMYQNYDTPAFPKQRMNADAKRLLAYIIEYNDFKKNGTDDSDTIRYESIQGKNNERQWPLNMFENVPKFVSRTHLSFLRNQLVR